jgi:hypothetical protein
MIVKVQISLFTNEAKPQVLVYNESRTVMWQGDAPKGLKKLMKGEPKKYFKATTGGKLIHLGDEVEEQEW